MTDDIERTVQENLLKRKRALVVDEESVSRPLTAMLWTLGCSVEEAYLGSEVFELVTPNVAKEKRYDLILSAIFLPDMSGYDLLIRLKAMQEPIPLILMTDFGYDRSVWFAKAIHAGLHRKGILYKPVRLDHLLRAATAVISESHSPE